MKRNLLLVVCSLAWLATFSQSRPINKLTMQTTYSQVDISKPLRDLIDQQKREDFFNDDYFNTFLRDVIEDKSHSGQEKVQLFYLMLKKVGYAFVGVNYLPPKQNYYVFHLTKIAVLEKTMNFLQASKIDVTPFLALTDEFKTNDPVISSNALLLAMLINPEKTTKTLYKMTLASTIQRSKNPVIINHYACLAASLASDTVVTANLKANLFALKKEAMLEDVICALYSKQAPLSTIKEYILKETNEMNDLAIQTALCVLQTKISPAVFPQNVKSISAAATEPWKKQVLDDVFSNKYPYTYLLTADDKVTNKAWDGVQMSVYLDGTLISNNTLLEFDPN
jgi:hypothetical protein